jgi:hypothetical protein
MTAVRAWLAALILAAPIAVGLQLSSMAADRMHMPRSEPSSELFPGSCGLSSESCEQP